MQEGALPTVAGVARGSNARLALPPMASPANVFTLWISEKDIGAFVSALRPAL
jgi:hypothetical protein